MSSRRRLPPKEVFGFLMPNFLGFFLFTHFPVAFSRGLLRVDSSYGRQTELILAATVMNIVPLIVIFVMFQKFLVKGLQLGGVKG